MEYNQLKSRNFRKYRASEILAMNREEFMRRFAQLEAQGYASNLRVFGSIARGEDTENSDIDLLVDVERATPQLYYLINEALGGWIRFPVQIVLKDKNTNLPESILREAIPL